MTLFCWVDDRRRARLSRRFAPTAAGLACGLFGFMMLDRRAQGLARLCATPYELPTDENRDNVRMHLTNFAVNKGSGKVRECSRECSRERRAIVKRCYA